MTEVDRLTVIERNGKRIERNADNELCFEGRVWRAMTIPERMLWDEVERLSTTTEGAVKALHSIRPVIVAVRDGQLAPEALHAVAERIDLTIPQGGQ